MFTGQTGNPKSSLPFILPPAFPFLQTKAQFTLLASPRLFPLTPSSCQTHSGESCVDPLHRNQPEVEPSSCPPAWHAWWLQEQGMHWEEAWTGLLRALKSTYTQSVGKLNIDYFSFFYFLLSPTWPSSLFLLSSLPHKTFCFFPAGLLPDPPRIVLTISKVQLGSFHCLFRNCQCLPVFSGLNTLCFILTFRANLQLNLNSRWCPTNNLLLANLML